MRQVGNLQGRAQPQHRQAPRVLGLVDLTTRESSGKQLLGIDAQLVAFLELVDDFQAADEDDDEGCDHGHDHGELDHGLTVSSRDEACTPGIRDHPRVTVGRVMSLARVQNFSISLDGFGTGEGLSAEHPFGHAGERLHEWMFASRRWHTMVGEPGGTGGIDDAFARLFDPGVGAEIMGAGKFGPPGWQDDPSWRGWWGDNPPFHTPTFILTHRQRPSIEMEGGTTFHFVDASPADALEVARAAAGGLDVRIGGGPTVVRDFAAARLVDHMHIVVVPILLGRGVRLWDGLEQLEDDYEIEAVSSPSGVTHLTFSRRGL
jgi:dihydrofolate reductase